MNFYYRAYLLQSCFAYLLPQHNQVHQLLLPMQLSLPLKETVPTKPFIFNPLWSL